MVWARTTVSPIRHEATSVHLRVQILNLPIFLISPPGPRILRAGFGGIYRLRGIADLNGMGFASPTSRRTEFIPFLRFQWSGIRSIARGKAATSKRILPFVTRG